MPGTPYCGPPPLPGGAAWTFHAPLLAALGLGAMLLAGATQGLPPARRAAVALGWALLCVAFVSPLCSLAVALFSARVAQHLLVVLVAAPLVAIAIPRMRGAMPAALILAALLWFWHLPRPYVASFDPDGIAWWWMHATLVAAALWFWAALRAAPPLHAALGGLVTGLQMGALGALLTFAPRPIYLPHAPDVTLPWGLTPLEDQQLGGLLMWVPGGLLLVATLLVILASVLRAPVGRAGLAGLAVALLLPVAAAAQGNDATTSGTTRGDTHTAAPVGVLTTSAVTTGSSGPAEAAAQPAEGADRRTRVLGPVCRDLPGDVAASCRAKSGM
jgi:putative membrane protein